MEILQIYWKDIIICILVNQSNIKYIYTHIS